MAGTKTGSGKAGIATKSPIQMYITHYLTAFKYYRGMKRTGDGV